MMAQTVGTRVARWTLLGTVFITGACVLVIELMGTRVMAPFYGSGIYTWSALIAVTLGALALGYGAGGRLADRRPDPKILFTFCLAAGLWTLATPFVARNLLSSLADIPDIRIGVLLSTLILFSPNLFLLGAIGPFVIRLITASGSGIGSSSGLVFSVSTAGSLFGALGTGFYLVPGFGVQTIFSVCGVVLIALSLAGYLYVRSGLVILSLIGLLLAVPGGGEVTPPAAIRIIAQKPGFYGQLQVVETRGSRLLMVDGISQNYLDRSNLLNIRYLNFLSSIVISRGSGRKRDRLLLIGVGAGHLPGILATTNIDMEAVELDPGVIQLARKYFGFSLPENKVHITDGRLFLRKSVVKYDHIVIDAFSADQVAAHLLSRQALETARARLAEDGLLAINLTSTIDGKDVSAIYRTLKQVFHHVRVYSPVNSATRLTSVVFLASENPVQITLNPESLQFVQLTDSNAFMDGEITRIGTGFIITDDYNPLGYYRAGVRELWRASMKRYLGDEDYSWMLY